MVQPDFLDALLRAGLAQEQGRDWRLVHPLLREVLSEGTERARWHRLLAEHASDPGRRGLVAGGADIAVNNTNKREFVELKARHIMVGQRQRQLDALRDGWASVMPLSDIEAFAPSELELLLCGVPTLDIEDWKANTVYKAGFSVSHRAISHFWAIVEAWNDDYRARLLRFVTGTPKVPPGGAPQR